MIEANNKNDLIRLVQENTEVPLVFIVSNDEIATTLNIHPYRVKLAAENTRKYSLNQVKKFLITLSNLDIDIKRGVKDRYIDFEIFLATANSL